jgi:hypothetical protein
VIGSCFWCCFACGLLQPASGTVGQVRNCDRCVPGIAMICDRDSFERELTLELRRLYPDIDSSSIRVAWSDDGVPSFTARVRQAAQSITLQLTI